MGILDRIKAFLSRFGGNTLYYPGCLTKYVTKELGEKYRKILRKARIDFIELKELEACCGSPVLNAGYTEDAKSLAEKNFKVFKEHSVKRIITSCPACFKTFSQDYPKLLKGWNIAVEHTTQTIAKAIEQGKLKVKALSGNVTYHDPCHLGRYGGVYDEPRKILKSLGLNLVEMSLSRDQSLCCGGGGGLKANYPELSEEIAKERIQQARAVSNSLVTACPLCYLNLKAAAKDEVKIMDVSEIVDVE